MVDTVSEGLLAAPLVIEAVDPQHLQALALLASSPIHQARTNIGAKKNFEFLVAEARGTYFAWCAHDDIRKPRFVSACVGALEQNPAAVLCNGAVIFVNEEGAVRAD